MTRRLVLAVAGTYRLAAILAAVMFTVGLWGKLPALMPVALALALFALWGHAVGDTDDDTEPLHEAVLAGLYIVAVTVVGGVLFAAAVAGYIAAGGAS